MAAEVALNRPLKGMETEQPFRWSRPLHCRAASEPSGVKPYMFLFHGDRHRLAELARLHGIVRARCAATRPLSNS
jgi:hypothetical protein